MRTGYSSHAYFKTSGEAEAAVRALNAAGFHDVDIDEERADDMPKDTGVAPPRTAMGFTIGGGFFGLMFGVLAGLVVFGLPMLAMDFRNEALLFAVGMVLCTGVGLVIGMIEGFKESKRHIGSHVGAPPNGEFCVCVQAANEFEVNQAEKLLAQFTHPTYTSRPHLQPGHHPGIFSRWLVRLGSPT